MHALNSKTFCLAPWTGVNVYATGEIVPCRNWHTSQHQKDIKRSSNVKDPITTRATPMFWQDYDEYINSAHMVATRKNQYNGVFVDTCNRCYEDERAGKTSLRKVYNKTFAKHFDFKKIDETFTISESSLTSLDVKFGNICNLKCIMCFGNLSSAILSEYNQHKNQFQQLEFFEPIQKSEMPPLEKKGYYEWPTSPGFAEFFNRFKDQLRWISFTGGEPTVNTPIIDMLKSITRPELVILSLTTNGSAGIKPWLPILGKFKELWINLSLEGIHDQARQIRYPSSWEQICQNIKQYRSMPNCHFFVSYLLQSFSVKTMIDLVKWCDMQDIKINPMQLLNPKYLSLNSVPVGQIALFKQELAKYRSTKNQDVIEYALVFLADYQYDAELHQQRLRYLEMIDSIRGTSLRQDYQ